MYRKIVILLSFCFLLYADKIEINAKLFEGSKTQQSGVFSGDVSIKQGENYLKCSTLKVNVNSNNKIKSYVANSVSDFAIKMGDKKFTGSAEEIVYDVLKNSYELKGKVIINEDKKELKADYVIIDQNSGTYKVKSNTNEKPVKLIFEMAK